jgi:hypothetical protein
MATGALDAIVIPRITVYSVKFLCGEFKGGAAGAAQIEGPVRPGLYTTAINVHNPHPSRPVSFRKKAVLLFAGSNVDAPPEPEIPKPPGPLHGAELRSDWGMEIDCFDIRKVLLPNAPPAPVFIKGWVVLEVFSPFQLDVEAVYTAQALVDGKLGGISLEMERVQGTLVSVF